MSKLILRYIQATHEIQMPPHTVKLIPEKIKEARESKGHTIETFAEYLGVSKQAVSQYETGLISPNPEIMTKIIDLCEQPLTFFVTPPNPIIPKAKIFWRSMKRMENHHRLRIARRLAWAAQIVNYVEQFIDLPPVNLPPIEFSSEKDSFEEIEKAAEALRNHWGIGTDPISDFIQILERNGFILINEEVNCKDMDAVSFWKGGRPYILYSKEVKSSVRHIFNLAHELGHILLHSEVEISSQNLKMIEKQAHRFAGAFLLPRTSFSKEIISASIKFFTYLKKRWKVSIAAMIYRCKELELITDHQYTYLMRQMNYLKIRENEPLDDILSISSPSILSEGLDMLIEHGVQTREQISNSLNINLKDVEKLSNSLPGFLNKKIIKFPLKPKAFP